MTTKTHKTNPADKVEQWPIEKLVPYAKNSRTHSEEQVAQIAASIKEWGFTTAVLVDESGSIIAGHGRVMAARKLGLASLPVMVAAGWTDAQKRAYVIADNKLALNAGWDSELLALELGELGDLGFDLELTGFSLDEIDALKPVEVAAGLTDEDAVPEAPADPVTQPGDVWVMGKHRLMCGDSTSIDAVETLMAEKKADFCFTSPPYNAARGKGSKTDRLGGNGFYGDGYTDDRTSDEYVDFNRSIFSVMSLIASESFSCCYNINYNKNSPSEYLDVAIAGREFFPLVETIGWEKTMAISLQGNNLTRIFEFIFVYAKNGLNINKGLTDCERNLWKISNIGANHDIHKAAFPVELALRGVELFAPKSGVIFEPFGGSGTTLIACEKTGRTARLMELDPKYCDVIIKRWQDFTGKQAIHAETGQPFAEVKNGDESKETAAA
jgi:DNA modification methylase